MYKMGGRARIMCAGYSSIADSVGGRQSKEYRKLIQEALEEDENDRRQRPSALEASKVFTNPNSAGRQR